MTKEERGDAIATAVWEWLQKQKSIGYVPWITDPKSPQYDMIKACRQDAKKLILHDLEKFILEKSKELKDDRETNNQGVSEAQTTNPAA